jgi:hypothetical protein
MRLDAEPASTACLTEAFFVDGSAVIRAVARWQGDRH